jgi:toxin-antitoxin system PIN domain toxin
VILLDVGVWLAAVWAGHQRHGVAAAWFDRQDRALLLCRTTQMSLLRLLTIPALMGSDALTRRAAWQVLQQLQADERVRWTNEPAQLDQVWRVISARDDHSHKLWTDDYLAAFAQLAGAPLATLDKQFPGRYPSLSVEVL